MEPNSNPDRIIAQTLAAPYTPRSQGNPLSFRLLPDGGMVVVISDGRKLWFSAAEVQAARRQVRAQKDAEAHPAQRGNVPVKIALASPQQRPNDPNKKSS